jgi:Domain of Unknown Function (DUF748)
MGALLKSKWVWIAAIIAVLVGIYAFVGFRIAPGMVRKQATQFVRETYKRELKIGAVRINPFLFQIEVRDVAFPDVDGKPMLGVKRFFADFELSSIWHRAYVFRELAIDSPYIGAVLRPDGSMNLADLSTPADPGKPPSELPRVWVKALGVNDGHVDYTQSMQGSTPLQTQFTPVTFSLQDFRTTPEGGDFRLNATGAGGAVFDWKGRFALAPAVNSEGDFSITNLSVTRVADLLGNALPFAVSKGTMALGGHYRIALTDITEMKLNLPAVSLADLGLRARGIDADWVQVPELKIEGIEVVMPVQSVSIAAIAANGLKATGWLNPDGTVSFEQLFAAPAAVPAAVPAAQPAAKPAAPPAAGDEWKVRVAAINLNAATMDLEDRMIAPGTPWKFSPLNLHVQDVTLDFAKPMQVQMDTVVNDQAPLKLSGSLALDPMVADLDVALEKARMRILQPYILPYADLTITEGTLGLAGKVKMLPPERDGPEIDFAGDVTIDGFKSTDNTLHEPFIDFKRVQVQKLHYEMSPDAVHIDRVLVRDPYARVIISREQIINISAVLDPRTAAADAEQKRATAAALASETKAQKRQREKQAAVAKKAADKARKKAGPAAPVAQAPPPADTMPIRIREVAIERFRMNFSDFSVQPNFSADIQDLNGKVTGLSSAFESRAAVDMKGRLGEFEPVTIGGTVQPFAFDRFTDIGLKFENISLPLFNPYSGRFAGYTIAKGKLSTDLHYLIQDRKLDAKHHVEIDQLEWGAATPTTGEATLPVKFATSLLKDKNGLIKLDIPVSGTLDDPKLRIGPIVWQIFKNLIVKAVTAPFALFGAMFKGAEDAQFVDFAPGSTQIEAAGVERLKALSKGLSERPNVSLDVPIGTGTELDRPVVARQHYEEQLAAATRAVAKGKDAAHAPVPALDTLEPKKQIEILTAMVKQQSGSAPQVPEPPAPPDGTSRADAKALRDAAAIEYLQKSAHDAVVVTTEELAAMGEARARSIQRALLTDTGLEPTRVFLTREGKISTQDGKVRFELGLK